MHTLTLASAAAILATQLTAVSAAVLPRNSHDHVIGPKMPYSNNAALDVAACEWASEDSLYVSFGMLVPNGKTADLTKALGKSSACSGYTQYQTELVGAHNTTMFSGFIASDFCTAYDVTKIIKAATGQTIGCLKYGSEGTEVGPDALLAELPEGGDDGVDGVIKRSEEMPASLTKMHEAFRAIAPIPTTPAHQ